MVDTISKNNNYNKFLPAYKKVTFAFCFIRNCGFSVLLFLISVFSKVFSENEMLIAVKKHNVNGSKEAYFVLWMTI